MDYHGILYLSVFCPDTGDEMASSSMQLRKNHHKPIGFTQMYKSRQCTRQQQHSIMKYKSADSYEIKLNICNITASRKYEKKAFFKK